MNDGAAWFRDWLSVGRASPDSGHVRVAHVATPEYRLRRESWNTYLLGACPDLYQAFPIPQFACITLAYIPH